MPMPEDRTRQIDQIRRLPAQLEQMTAGLTPDQLTGHFLDGEWSVAQNIHHLADSHMNSYVRCRLILTEEDPPLKPYDQDRWANLPDAQGPDLAPSLQLLTGLHARWVRFWESLEEVDWARTGFHPEAGTVTLADQLRTYAAHGEAHIDQISRTLRAQYPRSPQTKPELMARITREWSALMGVVDRLTAQQMATPNAGGWTPPVHLAHLTAWQRYLVRHILGGEPAHAAFAIDEATYAALELDGVNALLFTRNSTRTVVDILADAQSVYAEVVRVLDATPWAEIDRPVDPADPERGHVLESVVGNTYDHYLEHALALRGWPL